MRLRAGVVLPKSFATEPAKRYPVIYEIPGFSGTHRMAHAVAARNPTEVAGVEMLYVVLDPSCRLGHHVFADSDNNGPVGKALVEELIPHLERQFRAQGQPGARFLTGHSSGGWSSLWLQVTYPVFFGGTWSTAPDPVDFRDFQKVNIYEPGVNLFTDEQGQARPLGRRGKQVVLRYKPFSDMEVVMGRGGQLFSFEAVFSPKGADGKPRPLWDRSTGKVDPEVAKSWERYDIRLVLERNWKSLGPKLRGKLRVYMGDMDNFYLDGATVLLKQALKNLGSDAVVELFPGRDHGNLLDPTLRRRVAQEMAEQYRKHVGGDKVP
jgi:S-formylglutathione hydrolase FrmB